MGFQFSTVEKVVIKELQRPTWSTRIVPNATPNRILVLLRISIEEVSQSLLLYDTTQNTCTHARRTIHTIHYTEHRAPCSSDTRLPSVVSPLHSARGVIAVVVAQLATQVFLKVLKNSPKNTCLSKNTWKYLVH